MNALLSSFINDQLQSFLRQLKRAVKRSLYERRSGLTTQRFVHPSYREYYQYVSRLLRDCLVSREVRTRRNFFLDTPCNDTGVPVNLLRLYLQTEHTHVSASCPDDNCRAAPLGGVQNVINPVSLSTEEFYKVRVANLDNISSAVAMIDYSKANILNLQTCPSLSAKAPRHILIHPALPKPINTTFEEWIRREFDVGIFWVKPYSNRRKSVLDRLADSGTLKILADTAPAHKIHSLYRRCRIVLNVHQSDYHHTPEELRIIPAIMCGCAVISESSAGQLTTPFSEQVVWSRYEDLAHTTIGSVQCLKKLYASCQISDIQNFYDKLHSKNIRTVYKYLS